MSMQIQSENYIPGSVNYAVECPPAKPTVTQTQVPILVTEGTVRSRTIIGGLLALIVVLVVALTVVLCVVLSQKGSGESQSSLQRTSKPTASPTEPTEWEGHLQRRQIIPNRLQILIVGLSTVKPALLSGTWGTPSSGVWSVIQGSLYFTTQSGLTSLWDWSAPTVDQSAREITVSGAVLNGLYEAIEEFLLNNSTGLDFDPFKCTIYYPTFSQSRLAACFGVTQTEPFPAVLIGNILTIDGYLVGTVQETEEIFGSLAWSIFKEGDPPEFPRQYLDYLATIPGYGYIEKEPAGFFWIHNITAFNLSITSSSLRKYTDVQRSLGLEYVPWTPETMAEYSVNATILFEVNGTNLTLNYTTAKGNGSPSVYNFTRIVPAQYCAAYGACYNRPENYILYLEQKKDELNRLGLALGLSLGLALLIVIILLIAYCLEYRKARGEWPIECSFNWRENCGFDFEGDCMFFGFKLCSCYRWCGDI